jgi:hypothetical protein
MHRISLTTLCGLLWVSFAWGWGNVNSHPRINHLAMTYFTQHQGTGAKYAQSPLDPQLNLSGIAVTAGGYKVIDSNPRTFSVLGWIQHGGYSADEPELPAALRHFYDPLALSEGVTYLTDLPIGGGIINPHLDALQRAFTDSENAFTFRNGLLAYKRSMEQSDRRAENLALAFRCLGETMHLFADMTMPAHVRNDNHALNEPLEETVEQNPAIIERSTSGVPLQSNPDLPAAFRDLAQETNENFYSNDTISDIPNDVWPWNGLARYPRPAFSELTPVVLNGIIAGYTRGNTQVICRTVSSYEFERDNPTSSVQYHFYFIPAGYAEAYAKQLIPQAIGACANVVDQFLPTLKLTIQSSVQSGQSVITGELKHLVDHDFMWTGIPQIRYTGPGQLMDATAATPRKVADVAFVNGVMTPTTIAGTATMFVRVNAGGRVIDSNSSSNSGTLTGSYVKNVPDSGYRSEVSWSVTGRGITQTAESQFNVISDESYHLVVDCAVSPIQIPSWSVNGHFATPILNTDPHFGYYINDPRYTVSNFSISDSGGSIHLALDFKFKPNQLPDANSFSVQIPLTLVFVYNDPARQTLYLKYHGQEAAWFSFTKPSGA